ncbi:DUF262 domain-containing protein [Paenibacillus dendritiformis]|uniref:DUF262 domain-containing protein n=1 Tax=Paenibacillus dendritiformis TaxID=130049 RepID=UPI003665CDE3
MRLLPSDPDIQTIVARIKNGDIDLQPNFQRGEVWGDGKKKRLIDSILREWHVPPIHIVEVKETAKQEVLDGQQRLAAIRDFVNGVILVDGYLEPFNESIAELHNMTYDELPEKWRRKFDQFTIRLFRITDYDAAEPGELFFRLNQPTNLTAAEQRNAFFGPARQQVKELVELFEGLGLTKDFLGFSNSRMAYDDIISKVCFTLDCGNLLTKVTSNSVTNKYRSQNEFKTSTIERIKDAIYCLSEAKEYIHESIKFNKATLFSWLCFIIETETYDEITSKHIGEYISFFENLRLTFKRNASVYEEMELASFEGELLSIFNDRASSRVADVSSVISRDIILWMFFKKFIESNDYHFLLQKHPFPLLDYYSDLAKSVYGDEPMNLIHQLTEMGWGEKI